MADRMRVDTLALRTGAGQVRDCARSVDDAELGVSDIASRVPSAMAGARTVDAWPAVIHLVAALRGEARQLTQLAGGLIDVADTIEHRDLRLAHEATALVLTSEQA